MLRMSSSGRMTGRVKSSPEDFIVKEITSSGIGLELGRAYDAKSIGEVEAQDGKHITFVMQKRDWDTIGALVAIAKRMGRGRKSIGYAGTKDRMSVSVQLASVYHPDNFDMSGIRIKDVSINGFWRSSEGVRLGTNLGNAFTITIRDAEGTDSIGKVAEELGGMMPNYFGQQRFGERLNNARIGLLILKGDLESAVMEFLTCTDNERNPEVVEARGRLKEEGDFGKALAYFPKFLRGERTVLAHLAERGANYANALRMLPRGLSLMFVHAVQDQIFNDELEQRVRDKDFDSRIRAMAGSYGFPDISRQERGAAGFPLACIVGYNTKEGEVSDYAREAMERMGISKEYFMLRHLPELGARGSYRALLAPIKDFRHTVLEGSATLEFSLPRGSYATVLLNEFMNKDGPAALQ